MAASEFLDEIHIHELVIMIVIMPATIGGANSDVAHDGASRQVSF